MKATDIQDAIGLVDPVLIARAEDPAPIQTEKATPLPIKTRRLRWTAAVAAVLVLTLSVGVLFGNFGNRGQGGMSNNRGQGSMGSGMPSGGNMPNFGGGMPGGGNKPNFGGGQGGNSRPRS